MVLHVEPRFRFFGNGDIDPSDVALSGIVISLPGRDDCDFGIPCWIMAVTNTGGGPRWLTARGPRCPSPFALPDRKLLMPTTGTISAIIPTHGRDSLLEVALKSVLTQTRSPHEVVVVDDLGSTSTRHTVERIAGGTPIPVAYLDGSANQPKSAGASRNLGAASITGDYVAFLDDDDYWSPRFLEVAFDALTREGHDFIVGWTNFERDGRTAPGLAMPAGLTIRKGLSRSGLTGSNALIKRSTFDRIDGFDPSLRVLNDFDFLRRLLIAGCNYGVLQERLVTQVSHDLGHLSTRSLPRAEIIKIYLAQNLRGLSKGDRRHLNRLMHASARGADQTPLGRVAHGVAQAAHTTPAEYLAGLLRRIRTGPGMYH